MALVGDRFTDLLRRRLAVGGAGRAIDGALVAGLVGGKRGLAQLRAGSPLVDGSALAGGGGGGEDRGGAWVQAYGSDGYIRGQAGTAGVDTGSEGIAGGLDGRLGPVLVGVGVAATHLETSVDARASRSDGTLRQVGGYIAYDDGGTYANAVGSYYKGDIDSRRSVTVGAAAVGRATGEADVEGYAAGGTLGHRVALGASGIDVTPQLSGQVTHVKRDAFTETGAGTLSLAAARETRTLYTAAGQLRLSHVGVDAGGTRVQPYVEAGARYSWGDRDTFSTMQLTGAPVGTGAFTIEGARIPRLAGLLNGGLEVRTSERVTLGAGVETTVSRRQTDARANLHLRVGF